MQTQQTREQLIAEFTELRNSLVKRPPTSNKRLWNLYCDHLNDTDVIAAGLTDGELMGCIYTLKKRV